MKDNSLPTPVEILVLIISTFFAISVFQLSASFIVNNLTEDSSSWQRLLILLGESLWLVIPVFYLRYKKFDLTSLMRVRTVPGQFYISVFILWLSMYILIDELDILIKMLIPIPDAIERMFEDIKKIVIVESFLDWIILIAGAVVVAAVAEEAIFRGAMQKVLETKADPTKAVILSSATWTLIHVNPFWAIQTFITGVFLGYVTWRTRSILPAIFMHALHNLTGIILVNTNILDELNWYGFHGHIQPYILVLAAAGIYFSLKAISQYQPD